MGVAERDEESLHEGNLEQEPPEDDPLNTDPDADPNAGDPNADPALSGEEDEVVVSIGNEEPPASEEAKAAPQWVKELRERQRRLTQENAELRARVGGTGQPSQLQIPALPSKPTLAEHDYDEEKFQTAMDGWYAKKKDVESFEANQKAAAEAQQKRVQAVHENYAGSIKALGVKDYQDAEEIAAVSLDQVQQALVKSGATNPAALVYALGKNPKKLQELASIKDPVKFAFAAGRLETEVKVTKRAGGNKPAPDAPLRGGSNVSTAASKATLDRLEAEAERTGDRSRVIAYKRQLKQPGKK